MKLGHLTIVAAAGLSVSCMHQNRNMAARPHTQPAIERQIINAVDAGDGDYQTRVLRQRMVTEPDNPRVRVELAQAYRDRGFPELAIELCRLSAQRLPDDPSIQIALARSLRDVGARRTAVDGLTAFLKQHPQAPASVQSWRGIIQDELGLWHDGEVSHRAALERDPQSDYLHNNLGYNLLRQAKPTEAAAEFRAALKLNPSSDVARNNLGLALANTGETTKAASTWTGADQATVHNNLAVALIEQQRYQEARKELDQALGYNRLHPAALKNLALVSRLDGAPATMRVNQPVQTRWARFKTGFMRLWIGPLEQPAAPQKRSAAE